MVEASLVNLVVLQRARNGSVRYRPSGERFGLEVVDADLVGRVQVPSRLGKQRRDMTGRARPLVSKDVLPACAAALSNDPPVASGPRARADRSGARGASAVIRSMALGVALPGSRRDRKLARRRRDAGRRNCLCHASEGGDIGVPIGQGSPRPGPGVVVYPGEPERRRNEGRRRLAVWSNALPSRISSASNLPGPQLVRTFLTVASSVCSICV